MRQQRPYRFARIIVRKNGVSEWYGPIVCVRHEGSPQGGEITVREFEEKLQEAAQLYGHTNVDSALSDARSLSEAEYFFNNVSIAH